MKLHVKFPLNPTACQKLAQAVDNLCRLLIENGNREEMLYWARVAEMWLKRKYPQEGQPTKSP